CRRRRFGKKARSFPPCTRRASRPAYLIVSELLGDFHAAPEGDMIFDRFHRFFRLRVIPSRILIGSITDPNMVVACDALPRTCAVSVAWSQIFPLDRIRGKIVIALYDNGLIGFGNDRIFPGRLHEILSFDYERLTRY